jgi:hypothetical protein
VFFLIDYEFKRPSGSPVVPKVIVIIVYEIQTDTSRLVVMGYEAGRHLLLHPAREECMSYNSKRKFKLQAYGEHTLDSSHKSDTPVRFEDPSRA